MGESISDFMRRRGREVARFGREAEAAAHAAYDRAIRAGQDLELRSPGEVMSHGAGLLREGVDRAKVAVSNATQETKQRVNQAVRRAGRNPALRSTAIDAARGAGNVAGVVRGGVHAVQGLADGAVFVHRLANPLDPLMSPRGGTAAEQLGRGVMKAGRETIDFVRNGVADPQSVVNDVRAVGRKWRRELDPSATPEASTFEGELRRNYDIGQNQGEVAFDAGSLVVGGPAARAFKGLTEVSNIGNVERYVAQGFGPKAAARLAEPYPASGMGSHFVPRRTKLPKLLGGGPLPQSYMDGPFNKLVPPGSSTGDFHERHYAVDPAFHGTKVGGERWSGRDLGLKRYGSLGQLWYGSPAPLKARAGGLGAAAGAGLYDASGGEAG